ncbi:MAG: glycyl-tRNA synthetase beta subunit GlyS [Oceanicaulis sp. HLUCCA04]|nr:MAG: glycyl-tRNA synthetase beta subunit GlyS [Oceanicaulis sp. HLUCCA04]
MAQLLIELFCEEIPARMQARAEDDLARLMGEAFKSAGLNVESLETFSGPRRIGLVAEGVPARTADISEERKGPRVGSPDKAVEGFLRGAGLSSLDQCRVDSTPKGDFYVAVIEKPGRDAGEVIAEALESTIRNFPWPKSMKFGEGEKAQRWVRPLHRIICLLDGKTVPVSVFGIEAANLTEGHRIHSKGDRVFAVKDYADYASKLRDNGVILTRAERTKIILEGAKRVCADAGLELIEDEGLLAEVTGLAEWPVAVLGEIDPAFLDLPAEVIALTMKVHQKYFAVRDPKTGAIASKFVKIANQDATDGGKAIAHGAGRVVSARLSDARHFWDLDRKRGLEAMAGELNKVTFHEKLGTLADKVERVAALARELAPAVGADPELAYRAAKLAKADLVSQMVYEFPELQGVMGRYYALAAGEPAEIADAIRDHYKPQGPSDAVPTAPVSAAVALADKLDNIVVMFMANQRPTGSKDPFAVRRAAISALIIMLKNNIRVNLQLTFYATTEHVLNDYFRRLRNDRTAPYKMGFIEALASGTDSPKSQVIRDIDAQLERAKQAPENLIALEALHEDLLAFFADRLKVHLRDEGIRHDVIDAVFALGDDDLVRVTAKSRALQAFLNTEDGAALLAGYRRAANILKAEEGKGFDVAAALTELDPSSAPPSAPSPETPAGPGHDPGESRGLDSDGQQVPARASGASGSSDLLKALATAATEPEEAGLIAALKNASQDAQAALDAENFESAMRALASLRGPVDAFFERVTVNADDRVLRRNRLVLLSRIREAVRAVADFDRLEG